jgi:chaperonin GroES
MQELNYEPFGNFVLVKRIDEESEMSGGIVVPEIAQIKSNKGRVIAVGEGRIIDGKLEALPVSPGDIVLFGKYGAMEVKLDGEDYLLLRFDELYLKQKRVTLVAHA